MYSSACRPTFNQKCPSKKFAWTLSKNIQVSDWTSTLARLDCTTLLFRMPAPTYYYTKTVLGVGGGVGVVPETCLG